jgi:uncharacterized membrane protein
MQELLGRFHPQIVHTPVTLLIFSAFLAVVGRLFDREWVRKASVLLLVFGVLGAWAAVQSGTIAHSVPEHRQGVPEHDIDDHGDMGRYAFWSGGAALVLLALGARLKGGVASAARALALVLQLTAGVCVGIAGYRGGRLVFEHGANVRIGGVLVKDVTVEGGAADSSAKDRDDDEKK